MSVADEITRCVAQALRDAADGHDAALTRVSVSDRGGAHFEIEAVSPAFAGKGLLARQRLVLTSIKHLMAGDGAPVHAIDAIRASAPD